MSWPTHNLLLYHFHPSCGTFCMYCYMFTIWGLKSDIMSFHFRLLYFFKVLKMLKYCAMRSLCNPKNSQQSNKCAEFGPLWGLYTMTGPWQWLYMMYDTVLTLTLTNNNLVFAAFRVLSNGLLTHTLGLSGAPLFETSCFISEVLCITVIA